MFFLFYLFMRGNDPKKRHQFTVQLWLSLQVNDGTWTEIASIYDTVTNTYEPFHIPEAPFCGAQTILPDGRAILVGGMQLRLSSASSAICSSD